MTRIVKYSSKLWNGSVHIADPLTMPMVKAIDLALDMTKAEELEKIATGKNEKGEPTVKTYLVDERMIPAICECVEKWELENFPDSVVPDTFPASPRYESHTLIKFLFKEIYKVYLGEIAVPNE